MSGSDQFTSAYLSKESSVKTVSVTLADGAHNAGRLTSFAGDAAANVIGALTSKGQDSLVMARAATLAPADLEVSANSADRFIAEADAPNLTTSRAPAPHVVDRRNVSLADISQMRLDGCRTHQLTPASSHRGSLLASVVSTELPPPQRLSHIAHAHSRLHLNDDDSQRFSGVGCGRSIHRYSSATSPAANTLDTSVAILQHMALDTAARVEASRSGQSPGEIPSVGAFLYSTPASVAPPLCTTVPTTVFSAQPVELESRHEMTDPIGFCVDGESEQPPSLLRTGGTNQYRHSSTPTSSVHSLSESELCSGQMMRPLGTSRQISRQVSGVIAERSDETAPPSSPTTQRLSESAESPRRRLRLAGLTPSPLGGDAAAWDTAVHSTPADLRAPPRDASVYNHDFQRIISHEVKEALTRNMRPSVEDDEDEDEVLLHEVLSVKTSPPPAHAVRYTNVPAAAAAAVSPITKPGESHNCTFAPFQLPMGAAVSIGGLDSVVDPPPTAAMTLRSTTDPLDAAAAGSMRGGSPHFDPSAGSQDGPALPPHSYIFAAGGGSTSTRHTTSGFASGVSAQAWRFPMLGKETPTSAAARPPSLSGEEEATDNEAEEEDGTDVPTTATTKTGGGGSCSRRTLRTAVPTSHRNNDGSSSQAAHLRPSSGSSRQQRASDIVHPQRSGAQSASRKDAAHTTTTTAASTANGSSSTATAGRGGGGTPSMMSDAAVAARSARAGDGLSPAPVAVSSAAGGAVLGDDGGRLLNQLGVTPQSNVSMQGSSAAAATMVDDSYARKLEMVYTVYDRLRQQRRKGGLTATAVAAKSLAGSSNGGGPAARAAGQPASTAMLTAVGVATMCSSNMSSRAGRSPSLSCSGALGRSAGYYSFGKRVSLSHPNRQTLPHQYLGSTSTLHGTPSPRTAVLGSPGGGDLVVGGNLVGGASLGTPYNSSGPDSSLTHVNSANRLARRSLDSELVHCIEARPLLQSTLFLQHSMRLIRESFHGKASATHSERRGASEPPVQGSAAGLVEYRFPTEGVAASPTTPTLPAPPPTAHERNPIVTPQDSSTYTTSDDRTSSLLQVKKGSSSSLGVDAAQPDCSRSGASPKHVDPTLNTTSAEGEAAAAASSVAATQQTQVGQISEDVAAGGGSDSAHRYYRALTDAGSRVRHVHGVDGVEREVDNEALDLIVYVGMRLMGWLEVVSLLGCGSFGQVFLCKDLRICDGHFVHPSELGGADYEYWNCSHAFLPFSSVDTVPTNPPLVAVKVVKSVPLLEQQSVLEAEMLVLIGAQTAASPSTAPAATLTTNDGCNAPPPEDPRCANVAKVLADGICYGHHCIVMERYGANLYEYIAANEHLGLPMYHIRSIGRQLFTALSLIHDECHIIHADIKPENMLLTLDSCRGMVRASETTPPAAATAASAVAAAVTGPARAASPQAEPPRHLRRTEASVCDSVSPSPERSYITLRTSSTVNAAAGRHRHGRNGTLPLDASSSVVVGLSKGQSFCHLRSSSNSHAVAVEPSNMLTPEPRRLHTLNQSVGMLSSSSHPHVAGAAPGSSMTLSNPHSSRLSTAEVLAPPPAASQPLTAPAIPRLHVKLIDFSSSCYDGGPFYQYIQSRYYRAPEVIVGATYGSSIDVWSSGCMLAELLLGMPLLPGCNDHHQLCLIEEMVGPLPTYMVQEGTNTELYYTHAKSEEGGDAAAATTPPPPPAAPAATSTTTADAANTARPFELRTREAFLEITLAEPQPYRRYFTYQTLQELVRHCPLTLEERRMSNGLQPYVPANESSEIPANATPSPSVRSELMKQRFLLYDLLRRLLHTDAKMRPTATQILSHPFFTSTPPYMKTFMLD